jgi:Zn-dependent protease/predicted transcriptional regulator
MRDLRVGAGERSGVRLFQIFGIEIRLDFSVAIIFALIVYSLGAGLFPHWHPDWTPALYWGTAIGAAIMFFVSLLAHELSHSLVAQRFGIRVPRITLFLFGGVAEIESEADTPQAEFTIAIAGPLMSLFLGILFSTLASLNMDETARGLLLEDPQQALADLGPGVTACIWLGSVNMLLAIFNMIPGFPLDGGRVFRALIWRITGDHLLASRVASTAGRWFGWALMGLGLWNLLALKNLGGLWLILIGWFISHLASTSYSQLVTQRTLRALKVRDVMRTRFDTVPAEATVEDFVENYLLRSNQLLWPVVRQGQVVGLISMNDVASMPMAERAGRAVAAVMVDLARAAVLDAEALATQALTALLASGDNPVAVIGNGQVVGLVRGSDVLRWVMLHRDLASTDPGGRGPDLRA